MTTAELLAELQSLLGNRTDIATTRYYTWLTNSQNELAYGLRLFEIEKKVTAAMVVGTALYSLPSDCVAIFHLRDDTEKRTIRRSHYRKFDNIDSAASGNPTHYIRFGSNIQLTPVPSAANTMALRYGKTINAISASYEPTLTAMWHEVILLGAEQRGWKALGEYQRTAMCKSEQMAMIRSRRSEEEMEEEDDDFGMEVQW